MRELSPNSFGGATKIGSPRVGWVKYTPFAGMYSPMLTEAGYSIAGLLLALRVQLMPAPKFKSNVTINSLSWYKTQTIRGFYGG